MTNSLQEQQVASAFSRQAPVFDKIDKENMLITWMRNRIREEVMSFVRKDDYMLELNCGTGIDALYFASKGIKVKATDNAPGMLAQLEQKIVSHNLQDLISVQCCSFNHLDQLGTTPQYDYIFSDFGGLNCTAELDKVLGDIDNLLKPGGRFTLVIMPHVCLWEIATVFKGYFKTAFRRFRKGGSAANVEGVSFQCYYYDPGFIISHMGTSRYKLCSLKGLGIFVPPPFIENFIDKHSRLFTLLEKWENKLYGKAPFNRWGDHYMITMEKAV